MKTFKNIFLSLALITGMVSFFEAQGNFELINTSSYGIDISMMFKDPKTQRTTELQDLAQAKGDRYSTSILLQPTILVIFAGYNPRGQEYLLDIDSKKTKTVFLEYNHQATPKLQPQKVERKSFFSTNTNIKASQIKKLN
jgi:hypothetical protein